MKNLRGYKSNEKSNKEKLKAAGIDDTAAEKYGDMDEDELLIALRESVKKAKREGTFNSEQLQYFVKMLSPQLSEEQRKKLKEILSTI